jgi:hypothetical protein
MHIPYAGFHQTRVRTGICSYLQREHVHARAQGYPVHWPAYQNRRLQEILVTLYCLGPFGSSYLYYICYGKSRSIGVREWIQMDYLYATSEAKKPAVMRSQYPYGDARGESGRNRVPCATMSTVNVSHMTSHEPGGSPVRGWRSPRQFRVPSPRPLIVCPSLRDGACGHSNRPPHPGHDSLTARHANLIRPGSHRTR